MRITRYRQPRNIWSMMDDLMDVHRVLDSMFAPDRTEETAASAPVMNAYGSTDEIVIDFELPGVDPKDVEFSVLEDTLSLKARRELPTLKENQVWHCQERTSGDFERTLKLPFKVDANQVKATFKNGVLSVVLPRIEAEKPKRIEIHAA
jgi:HSP20 family protein